MQNTSGPGSPTRAQRKLGAILFADMTGYTAMMQEDESHARELRNRQRFVLETFIPAHHGTIIQYFGDGTLTLFDSATDAVRCGIAIQKELQKEPRVQLRIGIHSGDVVHDKEGIYGDPVNLASRIESISVPGAVLFSAKVCDEIKNQPDIKTKSIGKFHFKNVKQPIEVYAAINEGLVIPSPSVIKGKTVDRFTLYSLFKKRKTRFITLALLAVIVTLVIVLLSRLPGKTAEMNSIAVLPLENLSGDPGQDYFVSGMHETLITELSKISALKVISRTSMMQYKDTRKTIPQIARELGVRVLLEGSVLREADQVRITVQLIDGSTDKHIWSKEYNQELRGILALYSKVAENVAGEIKIKLTPQDQQRLVSSQAVNPRAYEYYLLGRHNWNQRTLQGYKEAIGNYKKALEQDSNYAPAYAALADCYMISGEQGGMPQQQARLLSDSAIRRALELNENLAEAHSSRGVWKVSYEWDWKESEKSFKRAIELNPGYAIVFQWYGRILGFMGRYEEAFEKLEKAKELDPLSPVIPAYIGQTYLFTKQFSKSEEVLQQALILHPDHPLILHNIGELYIAEGRYKEAIAPLKQSAEDSKSFHYYAILALAYARANQRQEAMKILNDLLVRSTPEPISGFNLAFIYLALGNKEEALKKLEEGYEQHDVWMKELKAWPWFDELRDQPRYKNLIRKMNFPG